MDARPSPRASASVWLSRDLRARAAAMSRAADQAISFANARAPPEALRVLVERTLELHVRAPAAALVALAELVHDG